MDEVIFRDIEGIEGYRVSNTGIVQSRRERSGKGTLEDEWRTRGTWTPKGKRTKMVSFPRLGGKNRHRAVHHLVLEAFVGPCPAGMQCRHLNDDQADNRIANLKWGTREENTADKFANGKVVKGERKPNAILTPEIVREIRSLKAAGKRPTEIGHILGFLRETVGNVYYNRQWKDVV